MARTLDDIKTQYGITSPEYAARVYEDMLDSRYERIADIEAEIGGIGENLEREKREIRLHRMGRRRRVAWERHEAEGEARDVAELVESADACQGCACASECMGVCGNEPPRVLDDAGDWIDEYGEGNGGSYPARDA